MSPDELMTIIHAAENNAERFKKLLHVFDLLCDDIALVQLSHDSFLPAARDYLRNSPTADYRLRASRIRRARLGGASRWLYHHQKKTFKQAVELLCPLPVPREVIDFAWFRIKNMESRLLSSTRR